MSVLGGSTVCSCPMKYWNRLSKCVLYSGPTVKDATCSTQHALPHGRCVLAPGPRQ